MTGPVEPDQPVERLRRVAEPDRLHKARYAGHGSCRLPVKRRWKWRGTLYDDRTPKQHAWIGEHPMIAQRAPLPTVLGRDEHGRGAERAQYRGVACLGKHSAPTGAAGLLSHDQKSARRKHASCCTCSWQKLAQRNCGPYSRRHAIVLTTRCCQAKIAYCTRKVGSAAAGLREPKQNPARKNPRGDPVR